MKEPAFHIAVALYRDVLSDRYVDCDVDYDFTPLYPRIPRFVLTGY